MKSPLSPFRIAVIIGTGTVFTISLLMILLPNVMPLVLYDPGIWTRPIVRGEFSALLQILPFVSLLGYFEAGFIYALLSNRAAAKARTGIDLVDEVGQENNPRASYPRQGAMAGILAGVFATLLSFVIYLVMMFVQMGDAVPLTAILSSAVVLHAISLVIAVIAGAVLGTAGGFMGSQLKMPQAS
jgi:hypothetical protein